MESIVLPTNFFPSLPLAETTEPYLVYPAHKQTVRAIGWDHWDKVICTQHTEQIVQITVFCRNFSHSRQCGRRGCATNICGLVSLQYTSYSYIRCVSTLFSRRECVHVHLLAPSRIDFVAKNARKKDVFCREGVGRKLFSCTALFGILQCVHGKKSVMFRMDRKINTPPLGSSLT